MKRLVAFSLLALVGCATDFDVEPEGYRCDPGNGCPAGYRCIADVCRNEAQLCQHVVCATPPPNACKDTATLLTYAGACDPLTGACSYPATERACDQGCADGACVGEDPCANVTCNAPPSPSCGDANTLWTYAQSGTCSQGTCDYAATQTACQNGCANGQCTNQDLCQNVSCNAPPAATCDGQARITYAANGTCAPGTGVCSYSEQTETCANGCAAGVCVTASKGFTQIGPRIPSPLTALDIGPTSFGNTVLAVGPNGFVTRWDGTSWSTLPSGTTQDLTAVWLSANDVGFVVGKAGTALRYDGQTLTAIALGTTSDLVAVHGKGSQVLIASADGQAWRSANGTTFTKVTAAGLDIAQVKQAFVNSDGSERLAGVCTVATVTQPCVAFASSGTASSWFTDDYTTTSLTTPFAAVGPSHELDSAYVSLGAQLIRHRDDGSYETTAVPTGFTDPVVALSRDQGAAVSSLFALTTSTGGVGRLWRQSAGGSPTKLMTLYGARQALSRNDSGGVAVLDGSTTAANVFRRGAVTDEALDLGAVSFVDVDHLNGRSVFINAFADLAVLDAAKRTYRFERSPATTADYSGVVTAATYALVFGKSGAFYRWTPGSFVPGTVSGAGDLLAGCRNSDTELYLVGAAGKIYRYDGVTFSLQPSGTVEALHGVTCTGAGEAFAVGAKGTVLRLSQGTWSPLTPAPGGVATLSSLWAASTGELFVAGNNIFARYANGAWMQLPAKTLLSNLHGSSATELYAVSGKDVVRFDGAAWGTAFTAPQNLVGSTAAGQTLTFVGASGVIVEGN